MWVFTVHDQSPQIRYGDSPSGHSLQRPPPHDDPRRPHANKPPDELPSYEEAIKLPPLCPKDTVQHV